MNKHNTVATDETIETFNKSVDAHTRHEKRKSLALAIVVLGLSYGVLGWAIVATIVKSL